MASTPPSRSFQKATGSFARPGKRQPMPTTAIGSRISAGVARAGGAGLPLWPLIGLVDMLSLLHATPHSSSCKLHAILMKAKGPRRRQDSTTDLERFGNDARENGLDILRSQ